jgi:integrase
MRRGEALRLTLDKVNLKTRIITLNLGATKKRRSKRVPIHKTLVQILDEVGKVCVPVHDRVFLNPEGSIPHEDSLTRCWRTAVKAVGFDPKPTVQQGKGDILLFS